MSRRPRSQTAVQGEHEDAANNLCVLRGREGGGMGPGWASCVVGGGGGGGGGGVGDGGGRSSGGSGDEHNGSVETESAGKRIRLGFFSAEDNQEDQSCWDRDLCGEGKESKSSETTTTTTTRVATTPRHDVASSFLAPLFTEPDQDPEPETTASFSSVHDLSMFSFQTTSSVLERLIRRERDSYASGISDLIPPPTIAVPSVVRLRDLGDMIGSDRAFWTRASRHCDPTAFLVSTMRRHVRTAPDRRSRMNREWVTAAWLKMAELLSNIMFGALLKRSWEKCDLSVRECKSLHLCEAPGAFVLALQWHLWRMCVYPESRASSPVSEPLSSATASASASVASSFSSSSSFWSSSSLSTSSSFSSSSSFSTSSSFSSSSSSSTSSSSSSSSSAYSFSSSSSSPPSTACLSLSSSSSTSSSPSSSSSSSSTTSCLFTTTKPCTSPFFDPSSFPPPPSSPLSPPSLRSAIVSPVVKQGREGDGRFSPPAHMPVLHIRPLRKQTEIIEASHHGMLTHASTSSAPLPTQPSPRSESIRHTWAASSLMEGGMSCAHGFIHQTRNHWILGPDGRGDLLSRETVDDIVHWAHSQSGWGVHLVTADGGMDIGDKWTEQEAINFPLVFAQYMTALQSLARDGVLVLKNYTLHLPANFQLIYHMCRYFRSIVICKPAASKGPNNEVYLIGNGMAQHPHRAEMDGYRKRWGRPASDMETWACDSVKEGRIVNEAVLTLLEPELERLSANQCDKIALFWDHASICPRLDGGALPAHRKSRGVPGEERRTMGGAREQGDTPACSEPLPRNVSSYVRFLCECPLAP